jgi:hypothetical protein
MEINMTDQMMVPLMLPLGSERAAELTQRMMQMLADEPEDTCFADCGIAAMYVMAAFVALIDDEETRTMVVDGMSEKVGIIVEANLQAMAKHAAAN